MKNWLTPVAVVAFAFSALVSCKKDEVKVTATPSGTIALTSSGSSAVLLQANEAQNAFTFTWNPIKLAISDGATSPAVTYQLQISKTADGFGYPGVIDAGNGTTKAVTVKTLNEALVNLGLPVKVSTPIFVRLAAVVGSDAHSFVSNAIPLTVTPYAVCLPPNTDTWGLVGPAGDGWPGATNTDRMLIWDCDAKAYILRTALNAGDFKFRKNTDWAVNLGALTKPLTPGTTPTTLKPNGEDMTITTPGTYTLKLTVVGSGAGVTAGTLTVTP
jgi:starch-binding outer membrane protein SusE/F